MEIRRWHLYFVISCVIITQLEAKTVSLNELIAAESKQKSDKVPRPKSEVSEAKSVSLNKLIAAEAKQKQEKRERPKSTDTVQARRLPPEEAQRKIGRKYYPKILTKLPRRQSFSLKNLFGTEARESKRKFNTLLSRTPGVGLFSRRKRLFPSISFKDFETAESSTSRSKTQSPLNYRKKFEIKTPLKPERLKHLFNPYNRKKQSIKREIYENEKINRKYVPLIKRLGLLVDDILTPGSRESHEASTNRSKPKYNKSKLSDDRKEPKCKCDVKSDPKSAESKPQEKTVTPPTTVSPEVTTGSEDTPTEAPATAANNTPAGDVNTVRPDPNLSLLFTRNSTSPRRDYYGFSERSSSTLHRDIERNITWNNGNDEHNTRGEGNQISTPDNAKNSYSSARNDASSDGPIDGVYRNRTDTRFPDNRHEAKEINKVSSDVDETSRNLSRRENNEHEKENKYQVGRKTEETKSLPRDVRRLRGFVPEHKIVIDAEPVQPEETRQESIFNVPYNHTSSERVAQRNGAAATENQELRQSVETVKPINDMLNPNLFKWNSQPNQVVTIFDGYSVARDINGRNKLSEKSIHISSKK